MAWSYTTGVLTSTGATEASPDSLLAGIAIVQTADATRGYANNKQAWLNNVRVDIALNSWVKFDDDGLFTFFGSTRTNPANESSTNANNGGSMIFGLRMVLIVNTTAGYVDSNCQACGSGGNFIALRSSSGINPLVIQQTAIRNDFPTFSGDYTPNRIDIRGLTVRNNGASRKTYFGRARNLVNARNVSFETTTGEYQTAQTTYNNSVFPLASHAGDSFNNDSIFYNTEWGTEQTGTIPFALGWVRLGNYINYNPLFPTATWNGEYTNGSQFTGDNRYAAALYLHTSTFKNGTTLLTGVNSRWKGARTTGTYDYNLANIGQTLTKTATTNGTGQVSNYLLSAIIGREAGSARTSNKYKWDFKARKYDRKTSTEDVFTQKSFLSDGQNGSLTEEVQMLSVSYLTLTEAQALALTGITFTPSGATGGTVAVSGARTIAELWQYYRAWIAQTANFDSNDTWTYDGTTLNIGAWTISGIENLSTGAITTSTATANGAFSITINGTVNQVNPTDLNNVTITGTLTYNTATNTPVTFTNVTASTVTNSGVGAVVVKRVNSTLVLGANVTAYTPTSLVFALNGGRIRVLDNLGVEQFNQTVDGAFELPASATGAWTYTIRKYAQQPIVGGFVVDGAAKSIIAAYIPDTFVVAPEATTAAYTTLNSSQQIYDYLSLYGATATGIVFGSVAGKGFGTLTVPAGLTLDPAAAAIVAIATGVVTTKTNAISEAVTLISTGNILQGSATLGTDVALRAANLDSELVYTADAVVFYPSAADRNAGTNAGASITGGLYRFKLGSTVNGVLLSGTVALRVTVGGVTFFADVALASGRNVLDLGVQSQLAAIKQKTDKLSFTVSGQVDSNVQYVNDVQVAGTGAAGDTWRPI